MPKLSAIINSVDRIAVTVGKQVFVPRRTTGRSCYNGRGVRINKPTPNGIIVSSVEVIQPRFGWTLFVPRRGGIPLRSCAFSGGYLLKQDAVNQQASPPGYHGSCQDIPEPSKGLRLSKLSPKGDAGIAQSLSSKHKRGLKILTIVAYPTIRPPS